MSQGTIGWQAAVTSLLLIVVAVLVAPIVTLWLTVPALLAALALNTGYAHALDARGRPRRRIHQDRSIACFGTVAVVGPMLAALVLVLIGYEPKTRLWEFSVAETQALLIAPAALFTLIFLSSLIDWYYVRPRIDGVVCVPPCRSSGSDTWTRPTRRWLLHRGLATVAYIAFALVLALVVMIMLVRRYPSIAGIIGGVGGIASLLLIFAGDYRAQLPTIARWVLSPAYCLGDDLTYRGSRVGRGFVLHVAVPVTKLVPLDEHGKPIGVAFIERKNTDLAEAELVARTTIACDPGCRKLNPECVVDNVRHDRRSRLLIF